MKNAKLFSLGLILITASCSSIKMPRRGVVLMMMSDSNAHVGIGSPEIVNGDHVEIVRDVCVQTGSPRNSRERCTRESVGHGKVTNVIDEKYSEVTFDATTKAKVGDVIVKHAH